MALGTDQLSLCEVTLMAAPAPVHPFLTPPPDNSFVATAIATAIATDELAAPIETVGPSLRSDFPIKVAILPNKGRSYVATRTIQPQELIFVAEAFGTTMCDPWLDCGVCHYCWMTIENRKTQVRLPRNEPDLHDKEKEKKKKKDSSKKRKMETVMVFCDETCLQLYGSEMAQMICRVEHKIRRTWNESGSTRWKIRSSTPTIQSSDPAISLSSAATRADHTSSASVTVHYSTLIQQALSLANTSLAVLKLNDQELNCFLDNVWGALDGLINEQESFLLDQVSSSTTTKDHENVQDQKQQRQQHHRQQYTQKDIEAFYPTLATYLLEGNNFATIAPKMSDDDCETARLISEVLYRRQLDIKDQGASLPSPSIPMSENATKGAPRQPHPQQQPLQQSKIQGERATFADYCAMQSNELVLLRQQLNLDISERGQEEIVPEDQDQVCSPRSTTTECNDDHHHSMEAWRRLISILPAHLLGCFYIYLRLRDAYLLLAQEEGKENNSPITLSIDNNLFRTILYAEVANSFGIRDASDELLGFAVFPRACFFNHSCRPNIEKKRRQGGKARQMEYWSTCVIEQGEECCISYGDISKGRAERMSRLEDMYFFRCSCVRCIEEEEEEMQAEKCQ